MTIAFAGLAAPRSARADPTPAAPAPLYLNPDAPLDARVQDLVGRLTVEEKATLLDHNGPTVDRFNIRSDNWNQCLHGVRWNGGPTALFPIPTGMAATWNPVLVHQVADALSDEARAIYNAWHTDPNFQGTKPGLIYRSPVINILRNPYWGRNGEAWSEDPYLCGRMAVAFVQGLQGDDPHYLKIAATLKHFAVNNVENGRQTLSATVSERMLHEYWLPHFRDAIVEGKARSIMASYNQINGVHNVYNHELLTDILRGQWGFDGFVVSDLGGVHDKEMVVKSLNAGCDFSDKEFRLYIPAAIADGTLSEARLDEAVTRVLRVRFQLGEFDPPSRVPFSSIPMSDLDCDAHRALSLEASRESIVLFKNLGNLLPLDRSKIKKLAVIGPLAARFIEGNPGYIGAPRRRTVSILEGLRDRLPGVEIVTTPGGYVTPPVAPKGEAPAPTADPSTQIQDAVDAATGADAAIVCVGTDLAVEMEGHDRTSLALPGNQEQLVEAVLAANPHTVVVLVNAGSLTVPWIAAHAPAIVGAWWSGEEQGHAVADVLLGDYNPAGRLPYTVYASEAQVPPQDEYDVTTGFTYMYLKGQPLFAFGHGLSYTTFGYSNFHLSPGIIAANGGTSVSVDVANTGHVAGDEVVQMYVHQQVSSVVRPAEELRGFKRVHLKPGEMTTVTLPLPGDKLAFWDEAIHGFRVEPGVFDVMVGGASDDIRLRGKLTVAAGG